MKNLFEIIAYRKRGSHVIDLKKLLEKREERGRIPSAGSVVAF